jgi:hypothetical protein
MITKTQMTTSNTDLQGFELRWRFTDPKFNQIPIEDLRQIQPNPPDISRELWSKYVSAIHKHSIQFSSEELPGYRRIRIDWSDKENGRRIIAASTKISGETKIVFFWSATCSVLTNWGTFLKYWDDFCYPDDDNNVIVDMQTGVKILYSEEAFLFP